MKSDAVKRQREEREKNLIQNNFGRNPKARKMNF